MAEKRWRESSVAYIKPRADGQSDTWTQEAGKRGGQRLVEVAQVAPPPEVARALKLDTDEQAYVRRRAILLDSEVIELADSYYPAAVAQGTALAEMKKIKGGAPTLLAELGYRARQVTEDLELREAAPSERTALALPEGASILQLLRTTQAEDGKPFEVSLMLMKAPRRFRYEIEVD
ncbi:UTRA domain-containing protein [Streptomyces luteocolor]|uniref:UTRA domain-containing protein n=1 Tax=Streptomyces luteocolor TaxID=285500 RepID=UPI000853D01B|nr:GntR family transcriptional regulator [Streptomyces luteocolor]